MNIEMARNVTNKAVWQDRLVNVMTPSEVQEYLLVKQLKTLESIKGWVALFGWLVILALIGIVLL